MGTSAGPRVWVRARALLCAKYLPQVSKTTKRLLKTPALPCRALSFPERPSRGDCSDPAVAGPRPRASPCSIALGKAAQPGAAWTGTVRRGFHSDGHPKGPRSWMFRARIWGGGRGAEEVPQSCSRFAAGTQPSPSTGGPHRPTSHKITPRIASLHHPRCVLQDARGGPVLPGGSQRGAQPPQGSLPPSGSAAKPQWGVRLPLRPRSLHGYFWPHTRQATCWSPPAAGGDSYSGQEETSEEPCQGCSAAFGPGTAPLQAGTPGVAAAGTRWGVFSPVFVLQRQAHGGSVCATGAKQQRRGQSTNAAGTKHRARVIRH